MYNTGVCAVRGVTGEVDGRWEMVEVLAMHVVESSKVECIIHECAL